VTDFARSHASSFDGIVMTELVEHIPDVFALLEAALEALVPGGIMITTTPNKSSFAADAVWATENPPIHLTWFSEESMRALAARLRCSVSFVDFTSFNQSHRGPYEFVEGRRQRTVPFYPVTLAGTSSTLPAARKPTSGRQFLRWALERASLAETVFSLRHRAIVLQHGFSARRGIMCVVFEKPA
jgi:hypothetical protein